VACSLDSLVVGEDQILGQVRAAHALARSLGLSGPRLDVFFEAAAQVGKEVRTRTELSRRPVSVVSIAVAVLAERLADRVPDARIGVVGAGRTGRQAALALAEAGLAPVLVVNRSAASAASLARDVGARSLSLDEFRRHAPRLDALVSATSAPEAVLRRADLERIASGRATNDPMIAVDLALPRDLEDGARGVDVVDLDGLQLQADANRELRALEAQRAEVLIARKLDSLARRFVQRSLAPTLAEVVSESREILESEIERLRRGHLASLSEAERGAVARWARTAFGRVTHVPISACKRLVGRLPEAPEASEEETTG
jgi:glutamyl-tRNA reductase